MADQWYYGHDGNRLGPCSAEQLKELAASGQILTTDTIWKEGIDKGAPAKNVKNLFPVAPAQKEGILESHGPLLSGHEERGHAALAPTPEALTELLPPETSAPPVPAEPALVAADTDSGAHKRTTSTASQPYEQKKQVIKSRAVALRGAVILSQDGSVVQFRKKCGSCGHEDNSRSTLPIRNGISRVNFYCRKCRKATQVEIQGRTM